MWGRSVVGDAVTGVGDPDLDLRAPGFAGQRLPADAHLAAARAWPAPRSGTGSRSPAASAGGRRARAATPPYSRMILRFGGQRSVLDQEQDLVEDLGQVDVDGRHAGRGARTRGSRRRCWLSRSDSLRTISTSRFRARRRAAGPWRAPRRRPRSRRAGLRISWAMLADEAPDGGQAVGLAHALLHLLDRGEILADADEPDDLAVARAQGPERDADGDLAPVLPAERELVAPRGRLVFVGRLAGPRRGRRRARRSRSTAGRGHPPTGTP